MSALEAIKKAFNIADAGDILLENIPLTKLLTMYEQMALPSEKPEERTYQLKMFIRTRLNSAFRLLFDVVQKVILSQTGLKWVGHRLQVQADGSSLQESERELGTHLAVQH